MNLNPVTPWSTRSQIEHARFEPPPSSLKRVVREKDWESLLLQRRIGEGEFTITGRIGRVKGLKKKEGSLNYQNTLPHGMCIKVVWERGVYELFLVQIHVKNMMKVLKKNHRPKVRNFV